MREPLEAALDVLAPVGGDPLARVTATRDAARWFEEVALVEAVERARATGSTWAQIGASLGVTGATATTRFGGTPQEREARAQQSRDRAAQRNRVASEAIGATPRDELPGISVAEAAEKLDVQLGTLRRRIQVARDRDSDAFRAAIKLVQLSPKREVMRVVDLQAAAQI
ncbi:hypothetical protein [Pseudoclavibacter sp. AY1F1]|uniref:hypothetical protein n=1 Tax=Pseudoclavibacter sp. AY1F1 TaxID=2080583 RepID=UPI0011B03DB6|nr:hypothetical protein [Pseudoclavibacter sp. AY1F1]